jgi:hypothetical protein
MLWRFSRNSTPIKVLNGWIKFAATTPLPIPLIDLLF